MKIAMAACCLLVVVLQACSAVPESRAVKGPMADDLVCRYNGDLACVEVPIKADTPSYLYKGTLYYFCSPECQAAFKKDPEKYIKK